MTTYRDRAHREPDIRLQLPEFVLGRTRPGHVRPLSAYRRSAVFLDVLVVVVATGLGYVKKFGVPETVDTSLGSFQFLAGGLVLVWMLALFTRGCYDTRFLGVGTDEFKRLMTATFLVFGIVAGVSYLLKTEVSRSFVFVSLPVGLALLMIDRWMLRRLLYRNRAAGHASYLTVILGTPDRTAELAAVIDTDTYAGYQVVGTMVPPDETKETLDDWLRDVGTLLIETRADAVAITPSTFLNSDVVRRIAWQIEGLNIDLLVAPALGDVAGPRISMRPAAGLPLIHLEEPGLSAAQAAGKRILDVIVSTIAIVLLSPFLLTIALLIKVTSPGPAMFRQTRIGKNGAPFTIYKFRTMRPDADDHKAELRAELGDDGPMFKDDHDPRITGIGRFLRRWSIDELPQLFNVWLGDMSLVGPRPHPIDDVSRYQMYEYRRLLTKPGMTGLWQVEGRSTLQWREAVRLDLYYVENWSVAGDLVLLGRTVRAVVGGRGAV